MDALFPTGVAPDDAIALLAGVAATLILLAIWSTLVERDPLGPRLKALAARRQELKSGLLAPARRSRRQQMGGIGFMRQVVLTLKLLRSQQTAKVGQNLARAGWRSKDAMIVYLFAKVSLPAASGVMAVVLFYVLNAYGLSPLGKISACMVSVMAGFYAPEIFVRNAASKRMQKLRKGMPDALDLMVICAEAGLSLDATLSRVAREMGPSCPELADEFGLTSIELGFLPERRRALENLNLRTGLPSVRAMVNSLAQTEKYGTPLSQSLRVLASEFRNERMMRAEEKAARLPATLTVPMVLFILPTLFIVLLGPAVLSVMDNFINR